MKAALIAMTIMGCDDSATQCHYIGTADQQWLTVAMCDEQAVSYMSNHQHENYPVIVAVCESASDPVTAEIVEPFPEHSLAETGENTSEASDSDTQANFAARALSVVKRAIPGRSALKAVVNTPVRYAGDGYSWIVKRFAD